MKSFTYILPAAILSTSASAFVAPSPASSATPQLSMAVTDNAEVAPAPITPNPAIKLAANGMSLLKPLFALEANIQAAALGAIANVDKDAVASDIATLKKDNKVLIYTYGLSPFSTEALSLLDASGYDYTNIELGKEWFLLGGEASETRVALSAEVEGGATSLPKVFIGGECIGGCAELASLVESGELEAKMKSAKAKRKGE
eukprot:CAMPEP_0183729830 /NCGR_PEP_ID=MMETSP0737-20130205/31339_1 /TAXON_ID=385413 /ORGANISM="Thalassiosira miniscula, Strain CCMP1093" /LENGTH=201 /DNA_ID=CAMNT_0025962135 /DNA_START=45 /DNA_END=647 /DNA_ORIENTATION=+